MVANITNPIATTPPPSASRTHSLCCRFQWASRLSVGRAEAARRMITSGKMKTTLMLKDYFLPDVGWRLQAPGKVGEIARQSAKKATIPALIVGGFLIGLCTVPCSGAVY